MQQNPYSASMQFLIRNVRFRIYGISNNIALDMFADTINLNRADIPFEITHMVNDFKVIIPLQPLNFQPIDAMPQIDMREEKDLADFQIFKKICDKEIIIPQKNIPELLEEILKKQDPKQAEIRARARKEFQQFWNSKVEVIQPDEEIKKALNYGYPVANIIAV
jgi:ribosomal protein S21